MKRFFFIIIAILTWKSFANSKENQRIQSFSAKKEGTLKVFLTPGLASVFKYPCQIGEAFQGDQSNFDVEFSPNSKSILLVHLNKMTKNASNLIAKCEGETKFIVVDLIPSQSKHQDIVIIRNLIGSIPRDDESLVIKQETKQVVLKEKDLISKSSKE